MLRQHTSEGGGHTSVSKAAIRESRSASSACVSAAACSNSALSISCCSTRLTSHFFCSSRVSLDSCKPNYYCDTRCFSLHTTAARVETIQLQYINILTNIFGNTEFQHTQTFQHTECVHMNKTSQHVGKRGT